MGLPPDYVPSWRIGLPLGLLALALFFHPQKEEALWLYSPVIGIAGAVLFVRLARWEGESADLWSGLAVVAFFLPALTIGALWGIGGLLVLGGAFVARVVMRQPSGRGPVS